MTQKLFSWISIACMLLVIFLVQANSRDSILVKEAAYVGAAVLALVLVSVALLTGRPVHRERTPRSRVILLLCILAWMFLTHMMGVRSVNAVFQISSVAALAALVTASALFVEVRWRNRLLAVLLGASALLALYGVLQWRSVNIFSWDAALSRSGRVSGSLGNPNLLGSFMAATVPLAACFILGSKLSTFYRIAGIVLSVILGSLALVASGTRASVIGLAAGVLTVIVFALSRRDLISKKGAAVLSVVLIVLLAGSIVMMTPRLRELTSMDSGTVQVRKLIWTGTLDMIAARPIAGWGPGSFQIVFPGFRNPMYQTLGVSHNTLHAHSEYLETLVDTGIIGALLWLTLIILVVRDSRKSLEYDWTTVGLVAALVAIAAEATVSVSLRWPPTAWLAAFLAGMLLASRNVTAAEPYRGGWRLPAAAVAMAAALLLSSVSIPAHLRRMSSGIHLFIGKDVYLTRIETEMGRALSSASLWQQTGDDRYRDDAVTWWMTALNSADSSIARCSLARDIDHDDLGAWYALGSAYLTRALLVYPQDGGMIAALNEVGVTATDQQAAQEMTQLALDAYDSLAVRAPNYAELHNNLALAYTRMGRLDDAFASLRRSWDFFGHRRPDYLRQVNSLLPLRPLNRDAWNVLWKVTASIFGAETEPVSDEMFQRLGYRQWLSGMCFFMDPDGADSLKAVLLSMGEGFVPPLRDAFARVLETQTACLAEDIDALDALREGRLQDIPAGLLGGTPDGTLSPVREYVRGSVMCLRDDPAGPAVLLGYGDQMIRHCSQFLSQWPGRGEYLETVADRLLEDGLTADTDSLFLETVVQLLQVDGILFRQCRLSMEDFSEVCDPGIAGTLTSTWDLLGGPRNCFYLHGGAMPWSPGSLLERMAASVGSLSAQNPDDPRYVVLELRFYYLVFSSLWWDTPVFTERQRDWIVNSMVRDRRTLVDLLGEEGSAYVTGRALDAEYLRSGRLESDDTSQLMEHVRSDLTHDLLEPMPPVD